jgi:hypothetical protein
MYYGNSKRKVAETLKIKNLAENNLKKTLHGRTILQKVCPILE